MREVAPYNPISMCSVMCTHLCYSWVLPVSVPTWSQWFYQINLFISIMITDWDILGEFHSAITFFLLFTPNILLVIPYTTAMLNILKIESYTKNHHHILGSMCTTHNKFLRKVPHFSVFC